MQVIEQTRRDQHAVAGGQALEQSGDATDCARRRRVLDHRRQRTARSPCRDAVGRRREREADLPGQAQAKRADARLANGRDGDQAAQRRGGGIVTMTLAQRGPAEQRVLIEHLLRGACNEVRKCETGDRRGGG